MVGLEVFFESSIKEL